MSTRVDTGPAARAAAGRAPVAVPDALVAAGVMVLGVLTLLQARTIVVPLSANVVGPRAVPYAVGCALLASGGLVLAGALRGRHADPEGGEDVDLSAGTDWLTLAKVVASFGVHVALLDALGWALSGAVLFTGIAWALGGSWWRAAVIGLVLGFVIQALFVGGLGVSLPPGVFRGVRFLDG